MLLIAPSHSTNIIPPQRVAATITAQRDIFQSHTLPESVMICEFEGTLIRRHRTAPAFECDNSPTFHGAFPVRDQMQRLISGYVSTRLSRVSRAVRLDYRRGSGTLAAGSNIAASFSAADSRFDNSGSLHSSQLFQRRSTPGHAVLSTAWLSRWTGSR